MDETTVIIRYRLSWGLLAASHFFCQTRSRRASDRKRNHIICRKKEHRTCLQPKTVSCVSSLLANISTRLAINVHSQHRTICSHIYFITSLISYQSELHLCRQIQLSESGLQWVLFFFLRWVNSHLCSEVTWEEMKTEGRRKECKRGGGGGGVGERPAEGDWQRVLELGVQPPITSCVWNLP